MNVHLPAIFLGDPMGPLQPVNPGFLPAEKEEQE